MMPLHQPPSFFDDLKQAMAAALHEAGQTDVEIGLACAVPPTNIADWRRRNGLAENRPPSNEPAYTPPVRREAVPRQPMHHNQIATDPPACAVPPTNIAEPGDYDLEIGAAALDGRKIFVNLEEVLTTRMLIQGNSGSGKSHLLRKLLEESAGLVQQIIIDPEGDFVTLADTFGHTVIPGAEIDKLRGRAAVVRELRGSVILNLDGLDHEDQMRAASTFIDALSNAPREHWTSAIVAIDEAQIFAPSIDNGEDKGIRKEAVRVMADLMSRGRKRGLAGILATQRIVKLHKNVAAEVSNFLIGRTFETVDRNRIGELTGMSSRETQAIAELKRGEFYGMGPAVTMIQRAATRLKVGDTLTKPLHGETGLTDLPNIRPEDMAALILAEEPDAPAPETSRPIGPPKLSIVGGAQ